MADGNTIVTINYSISPFDLAVAGGFDGTLEEWLESLNGNNGLSAFDLAVQQGFAGTEAEWLDSLEGDDGSSAFDLAVTEGFTGTLEEWLASLAGEDGDDATGGATVTVSGGATIVHDGSGTAPPTFSDSGSGIGTLVSNGNVILSVSGEFETSGSGAYVLNHDLNPPGQQAIVNVLGEAYFAATGAPPITGRQNLQNASSHSWGGLVSSSPHRFAWKF